MKLKPLSFETPLEQVSSLYEPPEKIEVQEKVEVPEGAIADVLDEIGATSDTPKSEANTELRRHLNENGGTLEEVAQQLSNIMCRGESESARLKAAEFISKMHGVQVELEEKQIAKPVTINIIGSDNKNLIQFLRPKS